MNRDAELGRPSGVACSDLLGAWFSSMMPDALLEISNSTHDDPSNIQGKSDT